MGKYSGVKNATAATTVDLTQFGDTYKQRGTGGFKSKSSRAVAHTSSKINAAKRVKKRRNGR